MERLDDVFGISGWKNEYQEWRGKGVKCTLTCKVDGEWISKEDGADETDMEATKGGFSNSMKRAAVQWGIGRYLYNLDQTWVEIRERGQNYINTSVGPRDRKEQVKGYWDTPKLPQWALPEGYEPKGSIPQEPHIEPDIGGYSDQDAPPSTDDLNNLQEKPTEQPKEPQKKQTTTDTPMSDAQRKYIFKMKNDKKIGDDDFKRMVAELANGKTDVSELNKSEASKVINFLANYQVAS
jgi:hypothetical protein